MCELTSSSKNIAHGKGGQKGVLLIEVLITMIIVVLGLLGLAGLQVQLQKNEMESYQRSQALLLLNDMSNRIAINRSAAFADSYVTGAANALGVGMTCPTAEATTTQLDLRQWCQALQGAAETMGAGADAVNVGALVGGRGCVEKVDEGYLVTVAWQGMTPLSAPPAFVACGADEYNGPAGSSCSNDRCRRVVTTIVQIATLIP